MKYSNVKLLLLDFFINRTGYLINPFSTTHNPKNQVRNCLKNMTTIPCLILFFGTKRTSSTAVINQIKYRIPRSFDNSHTSSILLMFPKIALEYIGLQHRSIPFMLWSLAEGPLSFRGVRHEPDPTLFKPRTNVVQSIYEHIII